MFQARVNKLRKELSKNNIDIAIITDEDSVYYYSGYYDYLHMEFGRPTILVISKNDKSLLITPIVDIKLAEDNVIVDEIFAWNDGVGLEWRERFPQIFQSKNKIGIEPNNISAVVKNYISSIIESSKIIEISSIISKMRMIKSSEELQLARHAGQVAMAMMEAGKNAISEGIREYEVALATSQAGTKKASEILLTHYKESRMSPNTHFLQIMASGDQMTLTHHRASNRMMNFGEPVFLCFCGMTNFHRFKLGFDRTFWIGEIRDKEQEKVYLTAVASQEAALSVLKPGITAETVHAAYAEVIQSAGYDYPTFRCGRGTGFSYLESPQLVTGDKTVIQPGMVFAVDGSSNTKSFRAQVGDSVIITNNGYEKITFHSKEIEDIII